MTGVWAIDRVALHRYLFRRADRVGRLKLVVKDLAAELDLNYTNLTEVIVELTEQGRLVKLSGHRTGPKVFRVVDPALFEEARR